MSKAGARVGLHWVIMVRRSCTCCDFGHLRFFISKNIFFNESKVSQQSVFWERSTMLGS
jgi:hypothetical protein